MKFCKNLQRVVDISDPEWSPYWVNYKMLKVSARGTRRRDSRPLLAQSVRTTSSTNLGVFLSWRQMRGHRGAIGGGALSMIKEFISVFLVNLIELETSAPLLQKKRRGKPASACLRSIPLVKTWSVGGIESPNAFLLCLAAAIRIGKIIMKMYQHIYNTTQSARKRRYD